MESLLYDPTLESQECTLLKIIFGTLLLLTYLTLFNYFSEVPFP
jgi:hypothetical protein